jgi:hypothetical protein
MFIKVLIMLLILLFVEVNPACSSSLSQISYRQCMRARAWMYAKLLSQSQKDFESISPIDISDVREEQDWKKACASFMKSLKENGFSFIELTQSPETIEK